jgi:hypothetical protein
LLIVHRVLGFRELRDIRYYVDDPLVKRVRGLKRLPDVATISRALSNADEQSARRLHRLLSERVPVRLTALCVGCVTLDFDGSVIGTARHAEGTAVGFNRKKKGQRSYYPLFCTGAQTGQVLDVLHRSGNVHDSKGATAFLREGIGVVKAAVPRVRVEVRMDSAFFSEEIISMLNYDRWFATLRISDRDGSDCQTFPIRDQACHPECRTSLSNFLGGVMEEKHPDIMWTRAGHLRFSGAQTAPHWLKKTHQRRLKSLFRYGFDHLRHLILHISDQWRAF